MTSEDDEGEFGYLTWTQWQAFQWAVHESIRLVPWLHAAGNYSIGDPDEARTRSSDPQLGLPATKLTAIEIEAVQKNLGEWDDLEDVANDVQGSRLALDLTRLVRMSRARWPYEDEPHRIRVIGCPGCHKLALTYFPPEEGGTDARASCQECGHTMTGEEFTDFAEAFAADYRKVSSGK